MRYGIYSFEEMSAKSAKTVDIRENVALIRLQPGIAFLEVLSGYIVKALGLLL